MRNDFLSADTRISNYLIIPHAVFKGTMSNTTKLLYVYLLAESLAKRNEDINGIYFLMIPIEKQTKILKKSEATIKRALQELENNNLILKHSCGVGKVNKIYVRVPSEE